MGERPMLMTKARRFAPQGMRILAELFEHLTFADSAAIALDWSNVLELQPAEVAKPVLIIETYKFFEDNYRLVIQVRLDVEDLFGADEIVAEDFVRIASAMEAKMLDAIDRAGRTA
jgi:hypothetical protein